MPDCIIHAAGLVGGIHANISRPFDFLEKNLQMGLNLVSVAKKLGIKKVLNLGSSCMYPKNFEEAIP
ncbi:NAD-dependent epimerase/dehydratase family protein, partial [Escherichia coli]